MNRVQAWSASSIPPLTVYTLGRFAVYRDNDLINDAAWQRRKAKNLFKLLLLAPNHQLLKDQVLEWLWPEQDPVRGANNLHRTLFVLRRVLQPDLTHAAASFYITFQDDVLTLNPAAIAWFDAAEFKRLVRLGREQNDALAHYEAARTLYQGDFLPDDLYEAWASEPRESLKSSYAQLLQQTAHVYTGQAAYAEAIACFKDLLTLDPTNEEVCCHLMGLYMQSGQRHQALQLYQRTCTTLQLELGVEPAPETTALYQTILAGRWKTETGPIPAPAKPAFHLLENKQAPLIGRQSELQQLESLLPQLESGQGNVIILLGEQGVGKTRLAQAVILRAAAAGMQVLYGAAHEQEGHLPYGPFVEAIRGALDPKQVGVLREKLGALSQDLARLLPEFSEMTPAASPQHLELDLGQERQRLFDAVTATLTILAQEAGLVVLLDDLHAAGESSLHLLHYLARRIKPLPILILCTIREEAVRRGSAIARFCKEFKANQWGQHLHLTRLTEADTSQLCRKLLGEGQLTPQFNQTLYPLTEGNPFFVRELVLALQESGKLEQRGDYWHLPAEEGLRIPVSIRETIGLRLERLSHAAYRLAGLTAVIGREFSHQLLKETARCHETKLLDLLDEMFNSFLIEETESGYRFYHSLVRHVIYDDLTSHRRAWLHGQVAQALEHLYPEQGDEQAAILAHHHERAGQYEVAFRYLVRAGDWARATYASREALDHYNQALNLCRQYQALAVAETMTGLLERRAQTHLALSDFEAAIADLEKLLEKNRETDDVARQGEALYQLGIAHYWAHRLPKANAYLNQALTLAQKLDYPELYTKSLKLRDILNSTQGKITQVPTPEQSQPTPPPNDLPAEEHWGWAMLAHLRSDFSTATFHAQACIELGQSLANSFLILGGYFVLGMSQASSGDYQLALDNLLYALELSETVEDRFWRARLLNTIGWVYRELFDLERAIHFDQASLELARSGDPRLTEAEGNALANLAMDYLLREEYDQVNAYLEEGLTPSANEPFMRWRYHTRMVVIKGRLALLEGDVAGALAAADESLAMAQETRARKNIARSCRLRGEALLAQGQLEPARRALSHALSIGVSLQSPGLIWPYQVALANFEEASGNLELARTYYLEAAEVLYDLTNRLTNPVLCRQFTAAPPVQAVFSKAVCPVKLNQPLRLAVSL